MTDSFYVYDLTHKDNLSQVRGVGRYLQLIKQNFPEWNYVSNLTSIPYNSIFINPFLNLIQPPIGLKRIAKKQIGIIYDLIPLKYPDHFPIGLKGSFNVLVNKMLLRNYDLIVTDSKHAKNDIVRILRFPEEKVKVIYPTLPKIFFNSKYEARNSKLNSEFLIPNSKFFIYVGDVTWNKNLVTLAKAIKLGDIPCVFIGKVFESILKKNFDNKDLANPWNKEFKEFTELIKDDPRFIFTGYITDNDLINFYKRSYLNVLLSRDEGFGFSYLESATIGTPSILSDIPVFRETADNSAFFVPPDKPEIIASRLKEVFENKKLRDEMGFKAQERAIYFSRDIFIQNWKEIFH